MNLCFTRHGAPAWSLDVERHRAGIVQWNRRSEEGVMPYLFASEAEVFAEGEARTHVELGGGQPLLASVRHDIVSFTRFVAAELAASEAPKVQKRDHD